MASISNITTGLTKKEIITGRNVARSIMRHSQSRIEYELLSNIEKPLNNSEQAKKERLLRMLSEFGVPKNALSQIKNAKRLDELFESIIDFPIFLVKKILPKPKPQPKNKHSTSLQENKISTNFEIYSLLAVEKCILHLAKNQLIRKL